MVDKGAGLQPGAEHYRAFVGPPEDYDLLSALQIGLLFALGLRESHHLCDVGCGSLRAGRLLMSYLEPGHYWGLEPEEWAVEAGIAEELGQEFVDLHRPQFRFAGDYGVSAFDQSFDVVLAQSVFSHTYADDAATLLRETSAALAPDGVLVATFYERDARSAHLPDPAEGSGWSYPGNVAYKWGQFAELASAAGLAIARLDWHHPRQIWFLAGPKGSGVIPRAARIQRPTVD